jgi:hypothetical protein
MPNLKLNNKICLEGKTQTGQYMNQEFDLQCSKYQVTLLKINGGVQ